MDFLQEILKSKEFKPYDKIKKFEVITYKDFYHKGLLKLYKIVFPNLITTNLINWKNKKNPFGNADSFTFLMVNNSEIIAQYATIPKEFYIKGKKFDCIQSVGTMTHPDYRGLGIITYLAKIAYEYAKSKGYKFVYGFPNQVIYKLRETKLNWTILGEVELFQKRIENTQSHNKTFNLSIKEVGIFEERINRLWENSKNLYNVTIKKDKNYLNWRYIKHPFIKYKNFLVLDESEEVIAFFILKRYTTSNGSNYGHIVDFSVGNYNNISEINTFELIENFSLNYFKEDCSKISFWLPSNILKNFAIKNLGYNLVKMNTYFGYRIFSEFQRLSLLNNYENWNITMGDSDTF